MNETIHTCGVCAKARHGAWSREHHGTHCRDCHSSWSGKTAAHTLCCHRTFSSNAAADRHLVRGRCTDPAGIERFELLERADGNSYWTPTAGVGSQDFTDADRLAAP